MAYVNVKDWSVDQVMLWLKGLDNVIMQYQGAFLNNQVTGRELLNFRADDLDNLGVKKLGHQEIILEAVEHLRTFHYELDKENLQMLALKLSCTANSLYKELLLVDEKTHFVKTQVMSDVHNIVAAMKPLVLWLDRSPFTGDKDYIEKKRELLNLGFDMAYIAHRGIFSENPVLAIKKTCDKLAKIADYIIQEICDPMVLQPASLDLATLKKKEQDLGFFIMPNYHPIHQITDLKYGSPAHSSRKIEEGDEIVQVNYQTVVGWQAKKVMMLLQEASPEIVLTLKKRPRHSKVYGQIYMKPYRLPSRKKDNDNWAKWTENVPSPRLMSIIDLPPITITKSEEVNTEEAELTSSDSEPPDSPLEGSFRMYPVKPRPILQRRNTITGTTPTNKRPTTSIEEYWDYLQSRNIANHVVSSSHIETSKFEQDSRFLRDKSASCTVGLDLTPRPTTVIGLSPNHNNRSKSFKDEEKTGAKRKVNFQLESGDKMKPCTEGGKSKEDAKSLTVISDITNLNEDKSVSVHSLSSVTDVNIGFIDEGKDLTDRSNMVSELPKDSSITDNFMKNAKANSIPVRDPILSEISVHNLINKFDEPKTTPKPKVMPRIQLKKPPEVPQKPTVPPRSIGTKVRGRLDKSHSTPAYDLTEEESPPLKLEKLPDVVPKIPETIIESSPIAKEEFVFEESPKANDAAGNAEEQTACAGANAEPSADTLESNKVSEEDPKSTTIVEDLPPKPPPRKSLEGPKPAYPADSPKPIMVPAAPVKKTFEFVDANVDVKKIGSSQSIRSASSTDYLEPIQVQQSLGEAKQLFDSKLPFHSTPVGKYKGEGYCEPDCGVFKSGTSYDIQKGFNNENKVSPTNSIVKAMISSKGKSAKRKNYLIAKRRKVTVNDLSPADIQGYLYQRLRNRQTQNVHWEKRYFVLLGNGLYGYKHKEDPCAACLIFLHDFTVAVASEVKSRSNAFKVYHTGTVFYFSADDSDTLQSWLDLIRSACVQYDSPSKVQGARPYSETDDSDTEKPKTNQAEKSDSLKKFGSLKKFSIRKSSSGDSSHTGSTSLDRKWFFNKSTTNYKSNVPVPTAQFRSYRKIRNEPTHASVRTGNFTSHVPMFGPSNLTQTQNSSVPNLTIEQVLRSVPQFDKSASMKSSSKPYNYVHASNPSITTEFGSSSSSNGSKGTKGTNESFAGLMTLEELMNRQEEENRKNPHYQAELMEIKLSSIKPDVVYGEVPIRPKPMSSSGSLEAFSTPPLTRSSSQSEKHASSSSCFGKRLGSLKRNQKLENPDDKTFTYPKVVVKGLESKSNRSLPRTLKIQGTARECEEYTLSNVQHYSSDKSIMSSFKKKSYEMIYCPETVNEIQFAQNRMLDDSMSYETPKKSGKLKRQTSFGSNEKKNSKSLPGFTSSKVGDSSTNRLKSAMQYTPITLPMAPDSKSSPKLAFELNLDDKHYQKSGNKLTKLFGGKSEKKEKTFLGSPKLHRTIFRKQHSGPDAGWPSHSSQLSYASSCSSLTQRQLQQQQQQQQSMVKQPAPLSIRPHVDYPGLEYPPIFEPGTYSLADPQSSLQLLRSRQKKENNDDLDGKVD